jgi:hypothetical protein
VNMAIVPWPLVTRADLVRAFKPGTNENREGPLRTLRAHHWVSKGVNIPSRSGARAAGSITFFSWLNLDAARAARRGDTSAAVRIAKEAAKLETSAPFIEIAELLGSLTSLTANAVVQGVLTEGTPDTLDGLLRSVAADTQDLRLELRSSHSVLDALFCKITRVEIGFVELSDTQGGQRRLERTLAEAAHRDQLGDCLALFSDPLGAAQVILSASPALDTSGKISRRAFSPFERTITPRALTAEDIALLSRAPKPLKIGFPVAIEQ